MVAAVAALTAVGPLRSGQATPFRTVGEEYSAPYAGGYTSHQCSSRFTCAHLVDYDTADGSLVAEMKARPNPGSPAGSGTAHAMSMFMEYVYLPAAAPNGLRVSVDFRVLRDSAATAESPGSLVEAAVFLNVHKVGCSSDDCAAYVYRPVLTATPIDDKPSALAEDRVVRVTVDLLTVKGKTPPPGMYAIRPMASASIGHSTLPTAGASVARAAVVVERISTGLIPSP